MNSIFALSFIILGCLSQINAVDFDQEYNNFKSTYGKIYLNSYEDGFRKALFIKNYKYIEDFNSQPNSYKQGINQFSDMTQHEISKYTLGNMNMKEFESLYGERTSSDELYPNSTYILGESLDYRNLGSVSKVKNQGQCGSCWAFSIIASLEGTQHKAKSQMTTLSEQELVDCYANNCNGNWPASALDYLIGKKKSTKDSCYLYVSGDGKSRDCRSFGNDCIGATPVKKITTKRGDENDLKNHLDNAGPISVCINVNDNLQRYRSGVFDDPNCSKSVNHAVTIVGYGVENGKSYWLVKNSWGDKWGDKGYIKMARNKNSQCAIADFGVYGLV